jgi:hypothetical protein
MNYVAAGGTANALTAVLNPAPAAFADLVGMPIHVLAASSPTGAATFNPNALGAKPIVKLGGRSVVDSDWSAGDHLILSWDGTSFRLLSAQNSGQIFSNFQTYSVTPVTLTKADCGKFSNFNSLASAVTLPLASTCKPGDALFLQNTTPGNNLTISTQGADDITLGNLGAGGGLHSFKMVPTEGVMLLAIPSSNNWVAVWGATQERYTTAFASSLGSFGYKKIPDANAPSGYITECWGATTITTANVNQTVTLPIAFLTAIMHVVGCVNGPNAKASAAPGSLSTIQVSSDVAGAIVYWQARGY